MNLSVKAMVLAVGIALSIVQAVLPARADAEEAPQGIYVYAGSSQLIVVKWGSPANVPDLFRIYRSGWQQPAVVPGTADSYYDNGLAANTPYTYHVCSVYGGSEYCTQDVAAQTAASSSGGSDVPAPTIGTISATSDTITVHWNAAKDYGFYNVRFASKGGWENQTEIDSSGNNGWYRWNQLTPGTTYTFKVQGCFSGLSNSHCSMWTAVNIATILPPPAPPGTLHTESSSYSQIHVWWTNAPGVKGLHAYRDPGVAQGLTLPANAVGYIDDGVSPAQTYTYKVCADYQSGGTACASVVARSSAPPPAPMPLALLPPTAILAQWHSRTQIRIVWTPAAHSSAGWFDVEHRVGIAPLSDAGASPWQIDAAHLANTTTSFTGSYPALSGGLHHIFRVCADYSNERKCSLPAADRPDLTPNVSHPALDGALQTTNARASGTSMLPRAATAAIEAQVQYSKDVGKTWRQFGGSFTLSPSGPGAVPLIAAKDLPRGATTWRWRSRPQSSPATETWSAWAPFNAQR